MPLAFVAMPLYVILPAHYGQTLGLPLSVLGVLLLATRLADALIDPWLGRWADAWLRDARRAMWRLLWTLLALGLGFAAVFFPPVQGQWALLCWCGLALVWTLMAYSLASVLHLAWGTRLGGEPRQRARLVAWREGAGLVGVVLANVLAVQMGLAWTTAMLWASLLVAAWALSGGPRPVALNAPDERDAPPSGVIRPHQASLVLPWRGEGFRRLLSLFVLNGVASALPATLVLFFIEDRLQAAAWAPVCLGGYFLVGALSVPFWLRVMGQIGPMRSWAMGMGLSVLGFAGVLGLGQGDVGLYLLVCLICGWALGADLTVPGTLLTGVVQRAGHAGLAEGAYAGWWQWATKLNLALAAGLALPILAALGYSPGPGARDPQALQALSLAYGVLPCVFKVASLLLCWRWRRHPALM